MSFFVFIGVVLMLPDRGSVSLLSTCLLDWCASSGVAPGLVYRQMKFLRDNVINAPIGSSFATNFLACRADDSFGDSALSSPVPGRTSSWPGHAFLDSLRSNVYDPVWLLLGWSLRLCGGRILFNRVVKAFAAKIGVKKVRLYLASKITSEQIAIISDSVNEIYGGRVDLILKVDKNLLNGWTLFVDFVKVDRSVRGVLDGVLDSLSIAGLSLNSDA